MIEVVRITGESFDLKSGAEIPKALVLSNGIREIHVTVGDEVVAEVVGMMAEAAGIAHEVGPVPPPAPPPGNGDLDAAVEAVQQDIQRRVSAQPAPIAQVEDAPVDEDEGPGEEYDDESTGVSSL